MARAICCFKQELESSMSLSEPLPRGRYRLKASPQGRWFSTPREWLVVLLCNEWPGASHLSWRGCELRVGTKHFVLRLQTPQLGKVGSSAA